MRTETIKNRAEKYAIFNKHYQYKMGGTYELSITDTDVTVSIDDREYYSGRGAKYNSSIRHDQVTQEVSMKELNKWYVSKYGSQKAQKKIRVKQNKFNKNMKNQKKELGFNVEDSCMNDKLPCIFNIGDNLVFVAPYLTNNTGITVTDEQVNELREIYDAGFKCYVKVDATHYLYCPCNLNDFSVTFCEGSHETMAA